MASTGTLMGFREIASVLLGALTACLIAFPVLPSQPVAMGLPLLIVASIIGGLMGQMG